MKSSFYKAFQELFFRQVPPLFQSFKIFYCLLFFNSFQNDWLCKIIFFINPFCYDPGYLIRWIFILSAWCISLKHFLGQISKTRCGKGREKWGDPPSHCLLHPHKKYIFCVKILVESHCFLDFFVVVKMRLLFVSAVIFTACCTVNAQVFTCAVYVSINYNTDTRLDVVFDFII